MDEFSISLNADPVDFPWIEELAREHGLQTARRGLILNSVTAPHVELLTLAGTSVLAIGRCINVYLRERKKRVVIMRPDEGSLVFENFTDEQITKILAAERTLRVRSPEIAAKEANRE